MPLKRHVSKVLLFVFAVLLAPAAQALSWIVPGVANTEGANHRFFFSQLSIANPNSSALIVTLSLVPQFGTPDPGSKTYSIEPGKSVDVSDLGSIWNLQGLGAVRVSASDRVAIFARSSVVGVSAGGIPPPTFGGSLPIIPEDRLLRPGVAGHAIWATQSTDPSSGERSNVGLAFPDAAGGAAVVVLYDEHGVELGRRAYDVGQPTFVQESLSAYTSVPVGIGRVQVTVTRGSIAAYLSVADNVTQDVSFFPVEPLPPAPGPAASVDLVSAAVAQIGGKNGAFWRTDARLANPTSKDSAMTAYLIGFSGTTTAKAVFLVAAGQTIELRDVVQSLFEVSAPAVGMILWRASEPVAISARPHVEYAGGGKAGTAENAVPVEQFLTPADGPADVEGIGLLSRRANVVAAAGPGGATYDVDLFNDAGMLIATASQTLEPLGWSETALGALFPTVVLPRSPRLRLRVGSGSVHLEVIEADNLSNDTVLFEALPRGGVRSPSPLIPAGSYGGAPNPNDYVTAEANTVELFRFCQKGTFPQPVCADAEGRFAVLGVHAVDIGPASGGDAILSGQIKGESLTVQMLPIPGFFPLFNTEPVTLTLGGAFTPYNTGSCPIEY